jgi:peptide/nickel transport system substrate-binding protein
VIHWRGTYPFANAIVEDDLGPLPAHLLEDVYRADKDRFLQLGYWSREFVGVGPYQIAGWEAGSHLTLKAFDSWYLGRPKVDTVIVRFIQSSQTVVANLLAGSIDGVIGSGIQFNEAMLVKETWERDGRQPLAIPQPTHWRWMTTQFRVPNPPEITDLRIRKGLLHAIDRTAMVESLFAGQAPVADAFIPATDIAWDWISDAVVRYPFDRSRAQQLLADGGWRRGPDGVLLNAAGERATVTLWTTSGGQGEQELAIIADNWKSVGVDAQQHILGRAESDDHSVRSSFPSFETTSNPVQFRTWTTILTSAECPSEQTRWVGRNRGCYLNPQADRIVDGLNRAIDPADQRPLYRDFARLITEELPILPLYFPVRVTLFREGAAGVKGRAMPSGGETWNIHEWDIK